MFATKVASGEAVGSNEIKEVILGKVNDQIECFDRIEVARTL